MSGSPSDLVSFGYRYFYQRSTRTIIVIDAGSERYIELADYMDEVDGRLQFIDSALAVEMFAEELEAVTIPAIADLQPRWAAVQLALPLIEMIGKIRYAMHYDNQNFKRAAQLLFPKSSIDASLSNQEYAAVVAALWAGLRCGVAHTGFMQEESEESIDLQINGEDSAPAIVFSGDAEDRVVEVGGQKFVEAIISGLRAVIKDLRNDDAMRANKFLPLWRKRWGSHAP